MNPFAKIIDSPRLPYSIEGRAILQAQRAELKALDDIAAHRKAQDEGGRKAKQ